MSTDMDADFCRIDEIIKIYDFKVGEITNLCNQGYLSTIIKDAVLYVDVNDIEAYQNHFYGRVKWSEDAKILARYLLNLPNKKRYKKILNIASR